MPDHLTLDPVRVAALIALLVACVAADVLAERRLRRTFDDGVPAGLLWTVRLTIVALFAASATPVLGWLSVADVLAAVRGVMDTPLVHMGDQTFTLWSVLIFLVGAAITYAVSHLARRALRSSPALRRATDPGTIGVFERLLHYTILAVGLGIALDAAGVNLAAFFAAGAVFAVGIGFAMQNIAQNFVSGVILLVERAIKPGDVLEVEGRMVKVQKMGIRSTIVRTLYDEDVIVPNSTLAQSSVKNFTLLDHRLRITASVGVAYESDLRLVRDVLQEVGATFPGRNPDREPVVILEAFGASSVDFELSVWIDDPWERRRATSALRERIWWALKDAHITIAFPQLDLHLDPVVVEKLGAR